MNLNHCVLTGRLTANPQLRTTPSGTSVATIGIASNYVWTDKSGLKQERADFHDVVVWGKQAEICTKFLTKGQEVLVQGHLRTREWQDKQGKKRRATEIIADRIHFGQKPRSAGVAPSDEELPPLDVTSEEEVDLENLPS